MTTLVVVSDGLGPNPGCSIRVSHVTTYNPSLNPRKRYLVGQSDSGSQPVASPVGRESGSSCQRGPKPPLLYVRAVRYRVGNPCCD